MTQAVGTVERAVRCDSIGGGPLERLAERGGKAPAELTQAIAAGVTIEMESATEAGRVAMIGERLGIRPRVAVRVNPDFQVKGSGMRMGGGPQQFGVDAEQVPALLDRIARDDVEFLGFHIFAGSQNLSADVLSDAQRKTVELALRLADETPMPVRYLNLGGGFGIPYFERDTPLDLDAIGENLAGLMADAIRPNLPEARAVVGCLCTPLDLLADNVTLPRAEIGDLVVIFQAGAYGLTASPTAFLGHPA